MLKMVHYNDNLEQVYPNILEMMINDKVIANGAKRYGIQKDPQVKKMIKMAGDQIVAQAYLAKAMENAITEADLRAVYDEEVKNFQPQEEIHARHILVLTEKQAQDLLIQLKAGADFGLLADQKSIDKNAPQGDLGYFTKDKTKFFIFQIIREQNSYPYLKNISIIK